MEKPDIKKMGLGVAEETVKMVITQVVRPYAAYYVTVSENKIDDIILPFMDQLEQALLEMADKIDGEVG
jgi:hypothetical protein